MGIAYRCVERFRCVFIVWDGDVTPDQWTAHMEQLVNDPDFAACSTLLADLSTVGGYQDITDDVIREMAARWSEHAPEAGTWQWAIVPNGAWGRVRTLEEELETVPGIHTMLFSGVGTAAVWLGIDPADTRRILADVRSTARADAQRQSD